MAHRQTDEAEGCLLYRTEGSWPPAAGLGVDGLFDEVLEVPVDNVELLLAVELRLEPDQQVRHHLFGRLQQHPVEEGAAAGHGHGRGAGGKEQRGLVLGRVERHPKVALFAVHVETLMFELSVRVCVCGAFLVWFCFVFLLAVCFNVGCICMHT